MRNHGGNLFTHIGKPGRTGLTVERKLALTHRRVTFEVKTASPENTPALLRGIIPEVTCHQVTWKCAGISTLHTEGAAVHHFPSRRCLFRGSEVRVLGFCKAPGYSRDRTRCFMNDPELN